MEDDDLKVDLFHLIDVLPMLTVEGEISRYDAGRTAGI